MKNQIRHVPMIAGERRLPACRRRQLADDKMITRAYLRFYQIVLGRLPSTTGWQPVLPKPKKSME